MKKTILILTLIITAFLQFSCQNSKNVNTTLTPVNYSEIKAGNNSDYNEFTSIKITSTKELTVVWNRFYSKYDRKPPVPNIDFETEMLIAVALGERNSGGFTIHITKVLESDKVIFITAEETKPGNSCASPSVMIYPFQLILVPKSDKEITYTKTVKINECGK